MKAIKRMRCGLLSLFLVMALAACGVGTEPPRPEDAGSLPSVDASPPDTEPLPAALGLDIVAAQGELKPLPAGAELLTSLPVADIPPWSYYISDVSYDAQAFVMVWRDTPQGGDAQWLCSAAQMTGDTALRHSIEYVEESYERSGENYLYFTVTDGATFHRSLWCFDPETANFNRVLDAPCSNMILLEHEPHEAQGIGWIVREQSLTAVDLAFARVDEDLSVDLTPYIADGLFNGIGDGGTHKFVMLSDIGGESFGEFAVQLEAVVAEPETSAQEDRAVYQMDLLTYKFYAKTN